MRGSGRETELGSQKATSVTAGICQLRELSRGRKTRRDTAYSWVKKEDRGNAFNHTNRPEAKQANSDTAVALKRRVRRPHPIAGRGIGFPSAAG